MPSLLIVEDDSYLHVSHGNYHPDGGSHFKITVVSPLFKGCSRIERHRQVHACLEEELKDGVHALCLKLLCPEEESIALA
ncbi:MAG: BolA family transcriptional regulator [Alphaproteobacteria bacterium]|nr:BolA family transcriptional regulator [Alphaproteobacteria bacterium]